MIHHHTSFVPFDRLMTSALPPNAEIIKQMARSLVACVIGDGLDLGDDIDVIECIRNACPQYRCRQILDHLDDALLEARQILIAASMTEEIR